MENIKKNWWQERWKDILITILPAILGVISAILQTTQTWSAGNRHSLRIDNRLMNSGLQSLFCLITLYVLIRCAIKVYRDALQEARIKRYLRCHCELRNEGNDAIHTAYVVVWRSVLQFFGAWLVVWLLWLAYYGGDWIWTYVSSHFQLDVPCDGRRVIAMYLNLLNFLSSAVLYVIYLFLSTATVKSQERGLSKQTGFHGLILLSVLALIFLIPSMLAWVVPYAQYCNIMIFLSLMLSVFAAVAFTLILGRLNSTHLQIPGWMISGLYVYAIVQAYAPLAELHNLYGCKLPRINWFLAYIHDLLQWITLLGKILLMLTLMWISDQQRLIFYIIHRSISLADTPRMLKRFKQHFS